LIRNAANFQERASYCLPTFGLRLRDSSKFALFAVVLLAGSTQSVDGGGVGRYDVTIRRASRETPSPHIGAAAAYDSLRQRVLVFGGVDPSVDTETATLVAFKTATGRFSEVKVDGAIPKGLAFPSLAYDSSRDSLFVFGGWPKEGDRPSNELWKLELNGEHLHWSLLASGDSAPPARNGSVMVFDSARDRLVLHGGDGGSHPTYGYTPLADLWSFDLKETKWSELATTGDVPTPRWNHSATIDAVAGEMFIFGGTGYIGEGQVVADDDLYSLDLAMLTWKRLKCSSPRPASVRGASMTFDGRLRALVLVGGLSDLDAAVSGTDRVWIYSLKEQQWFKDRQIFKKYRRDHVGVYDPSARAHLIHGGQTARKSGNHYQRGQPLTDTLVISLVRK